MKSEPAETTMDFIMSKKKVILAMSGGVDSSTAALLLGRSGYEVTGVHMNMGDFAEQPGTGSHSDSSACDAKKVAELLGIEFNVIDVSREFEKIIEYFCSQYNSGRTPNPCVVCNRGIKFRTLIEYAGSTGADFVSTGHYARVEKADGRFQLRKGLDKKKDQSYMLFNLTQEQLSKTIFPLGDKTKEEVRRAAKEANLPVLDKEESQDICFAGEGEYLSIIEKRTPDKITSGEIVDTGGNVIGTHKGFQNFTIGQRRGIGIARGKPQYVIAIDACKNRVVIGDREELLTRTFSVRECNWISFDKPAKPIHCQVRIRYAHKETPAKVEPSGEDGAAVTFEEPQRAVTPGQAAVFYDGDKVLGGGFIEKETE